MEFYLTNIERITGLLDELRETYRQLLYDNDHVVQGNPDRLADNIADLVQIDGNTIKLGFTLPAEWKYVENGASAHWPPPKALEDWAEQKPVHFTLPDGREMSNKQIAFLVGRKIAESGIEGKHLLEEAIIRTDFYNRMKSIVLEEMNAHVNKEITEILMTL